MSLIELFTDYVFNQKSLKEYVEKRTNINARGEFNDSQLIQAEDNLQRLKLEDEEIYNLMYETLREYVKLDKGCTVEYPINFIKEILKLYKNDSSSQKIYEDYKSGLKHYHHDA